MAKASAICKCEVCGKEFKKEKICRNRREADSFEEWAKENCAECPECYKARIEAVCKAIADEFIAKHNLPAIVGVSEKQTAYAEKLRNNYIADNHNGIEELEAELAELSAEEIESFAKENGLSVEDAICNEYKGCGYEKAYMLMAMSNASEIIDLLG